MRQDLLCTFGIKNNLFDRADKGISREVSDSITRIVNRYDNHYEDRYNNLIRFFKRGFLMKYSNMLVLLFFTKLSFATDFKLLPSDQVEDVKYFYCK